MGQKVHPVGMRLGIIKQSQSVWYAKPKDFAKTLANDIAVRRFLKKRLSKSAVSWIGIERLAGSNAKVTIHAARPGTIIGPKGRDIEALRSEIANIMKMPVNLNIAEIRKPDLDAQLVADGVAQQLQRRIMFRRAMKRAVSSAMRSGAKGVKIMVSGRLGGAEIARSEWYREGRVPLHTLRANIDYATSEALTTYGIIGIKVWIFKGEIVGREEQDKAATGGNTEKPRRKPAEKEAQGE